MDNKLDEKECEICGVWFIPTRSTQKYCSECGKHSDHASRKMNGYIKASIKKYGTGRPVRECHNVCKHCGKEFISYRYVKYFCSRDCRIQYNIDHTFCEFCGKPMTETDNQYDVNGRIWTCSDECKEKLAWKNAREAGKVRVCPQCGKEFIGKDTKFCSRKCYSIYSKTHKHEKEPEQTVMKVCLECGELFECPVSQMNLPLCSKSCRMSYFEKLHIETEAYKRKQKEEEERKKIETEGLCASCRTSYIDCERMQSNFTASPEGSVFKGALVIKCPKYRGPKNNSK